MKHLKLSAALSLALAGMFAAGAASAGTANANLAMSASVGSSCSLTGGSVNLGSVPAVSGNQTFPGQAIAVVTCNSATPWTLVDGDSANWNSTVLGTAPGGAGGANVVMSDGVAAGSATRADYLEYQIFTDNGSDQIPLGASPDNGFSGTGTGAAQNVNLDVVVYSANLSMSNLYSDTVPLTLLY